MKYLITNKDNRFDPERKLTIAVVEGIRTDNILKGNLEVSIGGYLKEKYIDDDKVLSIPVGRIVFDRNDNVLSDTTLEAIRKDVMKAVALKDKSYTEAK